jgi:hypothetical protein
LQSKVDAAEPLIPVLCEFNHWLQSHGLLDGKAIGFVADGPCDFHGPFPSLAAVAPLMTPDVPPSLEACIVTAIDTVQKVMQIRAAPDPSGMRIGSPFVICCTVVQTSCCRSATSLAFHCLMCTALPPSPLCSLLSCQFPRGQLLRSQPGVLNGARRIMQVPVLQHRLGCKGSFRKLVLRKSTLLANDGDCMRRQHCGLPQALWAG